MKTNQQKKLSTLENKFYYGFSRSLWHLILGAILLGLIASVFVIGWSFVPTKKEAVKKTSAPSKPAYPNQVNVRLGEILNALPKQKEDIRRYIDNTNSKVNNTTTANNYPKDTAGYGEFINELNVLKGLLPLQNHKTLWQGKGKYIYPEGKRKYDARKREKYRKWIVETTDLKSRIVSNTHKKGIVKYTDKAQLLAAYNRVLLAIKLEKDRKIILEKNLLLFFLESKEKTIQSLDAISSIISLFQTDPDKALSLHANFLKRNHQDGIKMLNFEASILSKFSPQNRYVASRFLKREYVDYYKYNLSGFVENTKPFITILGKIPKEQQAIALKSYYDIYRQKNSERARQIRNIDQAHNVQLDLIERNYQSKLRQTENQYLQSQQQKKSWRFLSLQSLGIGLLLILVLTFIILLLSMIRNTNKLAELLIKKEQITH